MSKSTLNELFDKVAEERGDSIALEYQGMGLGYSTLQNRVDLLAGSLLRRKLAAPGSCIGLSMHMTPEFIITFLAVLKTGASIALVRAELGEELYAGALNHVEADTIFISSEDTKFLRAVASRLETVRDFIVEDSQIENQSTIPGMATPLSVLMQPIMLEPNEQETISFPQSSLDAELITYIANGEALTALITPLGAIDWDGLGSAASELYSQGDVVLCLGNTPGLDTFFTACILPLLAGARVALDRDDDPGKLSRLLLRHSASAVYATVGFARSVLRSKPMKADGLSGARLIIPSPDKALIDSFSRTVTVDIVDLSEKLVDHGVVINPSGEEGRGSVHFSFNGLGTREEAVK